jgi:hypothetical protein
MAGDGNLGVLLALDAVLSLLFASLVLYGLDFVGVVPFTLPNLAVGTVGLAVLTYLVVLR